jgi:hypothetical protein
VTNKNKGLASFNEDPQKLPEVRDGTSLAESAQGDTKRTRHSFYLDTAVVRSLDQAYKQTYHELYPREISKSDFLEECLRYALSYLDKIKCNLVQEE